MRDTHRKNRLEAYLLCCGNLFLLLYLKAKGECVKYITVVFFSHPTTKRDASLFHCLHFLLKVEGFPFGLS
jgi:hypothetical protein